MMFKYAEFKRRSSDLWTKAEQAAENAKLEFNIYPEDNKKFKLVFAGQYSAGKSSIVKAMTGREDIQIGAGNTTETVNEYPWSDIVIVDTPGIHTEKRPEHDELSYAAIASADMLVFVVTNELFDSNIADHFRKLAIDSDKAGEMILVVNKMTRTAKGNTPEQQEVIRDALKEVVDPYKPEQLDLCFMDAESYLKSKKIKDENPVRAEKLNLRSGFSEFEHTLNQVVARKNLSASLTTSLYQLDDYLQEATRKLEPETTDTELKALEENYSQQRHALSDSRIRLQTEIKNIYTNAAAEIRALGLEAADYLTEGCNKEEVGEELHSAIRKANSIIEECQDVAFTTFKDRLNEIGQDIDEIENSSFTKTLKVNLFGRFESLPDNVKTLINNALGQSQKAGNAVLKNAYNLSSEGGLKLANFSGSKIHSIVLKAGHAVKYKFEPWQAIKITRGVAVGAQALSILGVGISVFMQIKSDKDQEERITALKKNRQNIRSQFNAAANGLEDYGNTFIKENISITIDASIREIDYNLHEIYMTRTNRSVACRDMENLHYECLKLIREIHKSNE